MNMKRWIWSLTLIPMMNKTEHYQRYADYIATMAASCPSEWVSFLDTMARNSHRSVQELLLIHLQRPEAEACSTYQEWIKAGRRVKRGSLGIAVIDQQNSQKTQYLFGLEDTVQNTDAGKPWRFSATDEGAVIQLLENTLHLKSMNFLLLVEYRVTALVDTYWDAHEKELLKCIMDQWPGADEYAAKCQLKEAAFNSACYLIMQRCGQRPKEIYRPEVFQCVGSFRTPQAVATLAEASRTVANQILNDIGRVITERNQSTLAEGKHMPSAFSQHKTHTKEVR